MLALHPHSLCSLRSSLQAVVAVQRDYGRRDDRKQSRLKYLVSEWGIDRFRAMTEQYYGKKFEVREAADHGCVSVCV